jgi:hypothetical protein
MIRQQKIKINDVDIPIGRSYRSKLNEYLEEKNKTEENTHLEHNEMQ